MNRAPGKPLDPLTEQFLRFVLSREGQEIVREGRLPAAHRTASSTQELAKLK